MNNNTADLKTFSKIRNVHIIFFILLLVVAILQEYRVLDFDFKLLPFYIISLLIILILNTILYIRIKDNILRGKFLTTMLIGITSIGLITFLAILIDNRMDNIKFLKNATKTEAKVTNIKKDIKYHDECPGGYPYRIGGYCYRDISHDLKYSTYSSPYYTLTNNYYIVYEAVGKNVYNSFDESKKFSSEHEAQNYEGSYKVGDSVTIYYKNNDPSNIRLDVPTSLTEVYITEALAVVVQVIYVFKFRKLYEKASESNGLAG